MAEQSVGPASPIATDILSDMGHVLRSQSSDIDLRTSSSLANSEDLDSLSDDAVRASCGPRCGRVCQRFSILYLDTGIFFLKQRRFAPCWAASISVIILVYFLTNAIFLSLEVSNTSIQS